MANLTPPAIASGVIILLALIICIISMATNYWGVITSDLPFNADDEGRLGLINACTCIQGTCRCDKYIEEDGAEDYLKASLAFICLAFIATVAAIVAFSVVILQAGGESLGKTLKLLTTAALGGAAFCNILAVIIFAAKFLDQDVDDSINLKLGWSWGMALFAFFLDIIGAISVFFVSTEKV